MTFIRAMLSTIHGISITDDEITILGRERLINERKVNGRAELSTVHDSIPS